MIILIILFPKNTGLMIGQKLVKLLHKLKIQQDLFPL